MAFRSPNNILMNHPSTSAIQNISYTKQSNKSGLFSFDSWKSWPLTSPWSSQVLSIFFSLLFLLDRRKKNKKLHGCSMQKAVKWIHEYAVATQKNIIISSTVVFFCYFFPSLYNYWTISSYRQASQMSQFSRKRIQDITIMSLNKHQYSTVQNSWLTWILNR